MSSPEKKINNLLDRIRRDDNTNTRNTQLPGQFNNTGRNGSNRTNRPNLQLGNINSSGSSPIMKRPDVLTFSTKRNDNIETEKKLREIMKISGKLTINGETYKTDIKDMEDIEELGNGTCGHVIKMRHKPSGEIIAVKQMRRSGNSEETKRIIMDIEVVLKSHDCKYIVQCLGCFITESEVWICMELMSTCFDKLLKRLKQPIPEDVLGKVTVATVEALSYLKDKHGVIHRDVKPSNILLDTKGNVKLCDFGISGRLVDSMAKTRSAGCAAYMAPERIEPDPINPDYDIRADVWSLGITLVELATGKLPYQDCKTDFEVLTKVISQDPPTLPEDRDFTHEFRSFVKCCLIKDQKQRPKYVKLKSETFIKKYESAEVDVGNWFASAIHQADAVANRSAPRHSPSPITSRRHLQLYQRQDSPLQAQHSQLLTNGSSNIQGYQYNAAIGNQPQKSTESYVSASFPLDERSTHVSRIATFHSSISNHQRDSHTPYVHQRSPDKYGSHHQSITQPNTGLLVEANQYKSYSPLQAYHNHIQASKLLQQQKNSSIPDVNDFYTSSSSPYRNLSDGSSQERQFSSPVLQRRYTDNTCSAVSSPYHQRIAIPERRWRSPSASPLPERNNFHREEDQQHYGNSSPIVLQRFYHQQKQQQLAREAEEASKSDSGKKRFASYIKLQLSGERSGRNSRHQSPEPPPRLNRNFSTENQSPLAVRKNFLESSNPGSPSLPRRYISPTPPIPPPRRLSESTSVPGSPQHLRARFHYTPEPQRRLFHNNDIS